MAKLEIDLQPEEESRLEKQAAAEGLSLRDYVLKRLRTDEKPVSAMDLLEAHRPNPNAKSLEEMAAEFAAGVSDEDWAKLPADSSIRYRDYLRKRHNKRL